MKKEIKNFRKFAKKICIIGQESSTQYSESDTPENCQQNKIYQNNKNFSNQNSETHAPSTEIRLQISKVKQVRSDGNKKYNTTLDRTSWLRDKTHTHPKIRKTWPARPST